MNENEIRREIKITKKVLDCIDRQLEELSKERLTGLGKADSSSFAKQELLLELSKERRALIRMISHSTKIEFETRE